MQYQLTSGSLYGFEGWAANESPLDYFDRGEYIQCLHGVILCLHLIASPMLLKRAVEDDGILHELVHLSLNIDLNLENFKSKMRSQIETLMALLARVLVGEAAINCTGEDDEPVSGDGV